MQMDQTITMVFHNQGLRSYIEVDLCGKCPRADDKGCCGYYSPVFYPCDFAYLTQNRPELLDYILNLPYLTILDYSLTVNNTPEEDSYRCQFHSKESGCILGQLMRESICRHFVCSGIDWESEEKLKPWKDFFAKLSDYENNINNMIAQRLEQKGLTLRNKDNYKQFFQQLLLLFAEATAIQPDFFATVAESEKVQIKRPLSFGAEWFL